MLATDDWITLTNLEDAACRGRDVFPTSKIEVKYEEVPHRRRSSRRIVCAGPCSIAQHRRRLPEWRRRILLNTAASIGNAAAASLSAATNTSIGTGIAATSPAGNVTAGLGASVGSSGSASGAASMGNGAAQAAGSCHSEWGRPRLRFRQRSVDETRAGGAPPGRFPSHRRSERFN